jgi:hypothetical protein
MGSLVVGFSAVFPVTLVIMGTVLKRCTVSFVCFDNVYFR